MEIITRNRAPLANGVAYGGLAIVWKKSICQSRGVKIANPEHFKVLVGAGSLPGHSRKALVLSCYPELGEGVKSDHWTAYVAAALERSEVFRREVYQYRHYLADSVEKFKKWIVSFDWRAVFEAGSSNSKAEAYQAAVTGAIEICFPLKERKKKSTDLPWMTKAIRKQIEDRKALFVREGGVRTTAWKEKKKTKDLIKESKRGYMNVQREYTLAEDVDRNNFFKHVKNFSHLEKPPQFDVRNLREFSGASDKEVAERLADYFNRISHEFDPLQDSDLPVTFEAGLPVLQRHEVAGRIRRFGKPKSMVPGDIFPHIFLTFL